MQLEQRSVLIVSLSPALYTIGTYVVNVKKKSQYIKCFEINGADFFFYSAWYFLSYLKKEWKGRKGFSCIQTHSFLSLEMFTLTSIACRSKYNDK